MKLKNLKWPWQWEAEPLKDSVKNKKELRRFKFPVETLNELTRLSDAFQAKKKGQDRNARLKLWEFIATVFPILFTAQRVKEDTPTWHVWWESVFVVWIREGDVEDWKENKK